MGEAFVAGVVAGKEGDPFEILSDRSLASSLALGTDVPTAAPSLGRALFLPCAALLSPDGARALPPNCNSGLSSTFRPEDILEQSPLGWSTSDNCCGPPDVV